MPGPVHEGIVALLANCPELVFELARCCGALLHGGHEEVRTSPRTFQDPGDAGKTFVADWVLVGWAPTAPGGTLRAVDGIVIEVQLEHDSLKWVAWSIYQIGIRSRHRCRAWTLVVSPEPGVRARARAMYLHDPELRPLIVEPEMIPPIVEISAALAKPYETILAAVFHAKGPLGVACGRAAMAALNEVPANERLTYLRLLENCFTKEQMMEIKIDWDDLPKCSPDYVLSEFEKQGASYNFGLDDGREQVCATLADTLLSALEERGLELRRRHRRLISTCTDPNVLSRWLLRASTIESPAQLFSTAH